MAHTANTAGEFYKGLSNFQWATSSAGDTVGMADNIGVSFSMTADGVRVRTGKNSWPKNGGSVNKNLTLTVSGKDLRARSTQLVPGTTLFDLRATLFGAGDAASYYAHLDIDQGQVDSSGGGVENQGTDVEGGDVVITAVCARDAADTVVPFSWSLWATT